VGLAILTNSNNNITEHNNTKDNTVALQQAVLHDKSDVIFSTPAGLLKHIQQKTLVLKHSVDTLVVDKADLVLSFG
jgi:ATP-dependent RNA helicase DDX56/DBP9